MRADWNYVSGQDDLEEFSSAVQRLPTSQDLEQSLLHQGRPAAFEERLEDADLADDAENLFGLIHSHRERNRLPLLQGLTWQKWITLLEHTSALPERPPPPRVPLPIPLPQSDRWTRQLVPLGRVAPPMGRVVPPRSPTRGMIPSAPTSKCSSAPGRRPTTKNATSSS